MVVDLCNEERDYIFPAIEADAMVYIHSYEQGRAKPSLTIQMTISWSTAEPTDEKIRCQRQTRDELWTHKF